MAKSGLPRLSYNSPAILTFSLAAFLIMLADVPLRGLALEYFAVYPDFDFTSPVNYFRLFSHVFGHRNWSHLAANLSVILLIGPILEEKYGSRTLLKMMFITALATGILNAAFFATGLMGASGLAFMMILLASFANHREGEIPLTFLLVLLLFLSREVAQAFSQDDVSQFAHIIGGACGSLFGFLRGPRTR